MGGTGAFCDFGSGDFGPSPGGVSKDPAEVETRLGPAVRSPRDLERMVRDLALAAEANIGLAPRRVATARSDNEP